MSVNAGSIIHVAGNSVIDRLQSAGLSNVNVPLTVVQEIGNDSIVDKIPGDPQFTFSMESWDVSTELEALLMGEHATSATFASGQALDVTDVDGTEYKFSKCQYVTIASPWKDPLSSGGVVNAGHLVPAYWPTRISYSYGVSDQAAETVELSGGAFYYAKGAPVEQFAAGGSASYVTSDPAIPYRIGGAAGTTFKSVFGVIVNGAVMIEGVDYTSTPTNSPNPAVATITFTTATPATDVNGQPTVVKFSYFTTAAKSFPQPVHASVITKPGAVRGRNICVYLTDAKLKLASVQQFTLEGTVTGQFDYEFCNMDSIGYTVTQRDVNGTITVRSRDAAAFFSMLSEMTGVAPAEVQGWLNQNAIKLEVQIQNPKNPAAILKTLYVSDAIFQTPATPARVNTPTDFVINYTSQSGEFSAFKGLRP